MCGEWRYLILQRIFLSQAVHPVIQFNVTSGTPKRQCQFLIHYHTLEVVALWFSWTAHPAPWWSSHKVIHESLLPAQRSWYTLVGKTNQRFSNTQSSMKKKASIYNGLPMKTHIQWATIEQYGLDCWIRDMKW